MQDKIKATGGKGQTAEQLQEIDNDLLES